MKKTNHPTTDEELTLWHRGYTHIVGMDEVGRGAFAGPLVAAGVIITNSSKLVEGVDDSKRLSAKTREQLCPLIQKNCLAYYIAEISADFINERGIALACHAAFAEISTHIQPTPQFHLIDGYPVPTIAKSCQKGIIKGDQHCYSVAAASILAKVYRDRLMHTLNESYPEYGFTEHVGYGTKKHRAALLKYGLTPHHRVVFCQNTIASHMV